MDSLHNIDPTKLKNFFDALAEFPNLKRAAAIARVDARTIFKNLRKDKKLKESFDLAFRLGVNTLEEEAVRRARDGITKDIYYQGEVCGQVQNYSDQLLMFLLKAYDKSTFGDRVDHVSSDGSMTPSNNVVVEATGDTLTTLKDLAKKVFDGEAEDEDV
jgi:hypothetical protein